MGEFINPIGSMYGIFPYIWLIFMVNVGKYAIHGPYGNDMAYFFLVNVKGTLKPWNLRTKNEFPFFFQILGSCRVQ